jgi:aldehyde:ferredoxin oxidoreductase
MEIRIDPHTLRRAAERGASEAEILDVLANGAPVAARAGRWGKAKVYDFNQQRLGRTYRQKRIEVIYTEENETIVTVTVYVFFGEWEVRSADSL